MDKDKGIDHKRKTFVPVLLMVWVFLFVPRLLLFPVSDNSEQESGKIRVGAESFSYQRSLESVYITNSQNQPVFSSTSQEKNTIILNLGFSQVFHSFFVFKEKYDSRSSSYQLTLELENETIPVISRSGTAFYTPLLVEVNNNHQKISSLLQPQNTHFWWYLFEVWLVS